MGNKSLANVLVRNTIWVYIGKIITQIISVISTILIIKKLDVEVFGTFNFLFGSIFLFNIFGISPVVDILNRYLPELINFKSSSKIKKLVVLGSIISLFACIIILLILYAFDKQFASFFRMPDFNKYFLSFTVYVMFTVLKTLVLAILTSFLMHKLASILNIIISFLRSILYFVFLSQLSVDLLLYIESIVSIVFFVPAIFYIFNYLKNYKTTIVTSHESVNSKRVTKFGILSLLNQIGSGIVSKTSDLYIVSAMSNLQNVGLYSFAYRVYDIMNKILPVNEFLTVLRPIMITRFVDNFEYKSFITIYNFIVKIMIPIFTFPFLYIIIFGEPLINYIFDPKYISAYTVTWLVMLSNVVTAIYYPLGLIVQFKERMDVAVKSKIVALFSIAAGIIGMKLYGIRGVATATLIGMFLKNAYMHYLMYKKDKLVYTIDTFKNYFISYSIILIVFMPFNHVFSSLVPFILGSLVFTLLFILVTIFFHPFNQYDMVYLEKIANSVSYTQKIRNWIVNIYNLKRFVYLKI